MVKAFISLWIFVAGAVAMAEEPVTPWQIDLFPTLSDAKKEPSKDCQILLNWLKSSGKSDDELSRTLKEIKALKKQESKQLKGKAHQISMVFIENNQLFEHMMELLSEGNSEGLGLLVQPYYIDAVDYAVQAMELAQEIHNLPESVKAEEPVKVDLLMDDFAEANKRFGRIYARYTMIVELLESVRDGKGVGGVKSFQTAPKIEGNPINNTSVIYHLKNGKAQETAAQVLKYLTRDEKDYMDQRWAKQQNSRHQTVVPYPDREIMKTLFLNPYDYQARAGLQQNRLDRQTLRTQRGRRLAHWFAKIYMTATGTVTFKFVPEYVRKFVLAVGGLSYDDFMLYSYLGPVFSIVRITRFADESGNVVVGANDLLLDLQLGHLQESLAAAKSDDLLITFRRLPTFRKAWILLKNYVEKNEEHSELKDRMALAEKRAIQLQDLPYMASIDNKAHMQFATIALIESSAVAAHASGLDRAALEWAQRVMGF